MKNKLIDVNKNFFINNPDKKRSINVYSFRRYTDQELKRIEDRARRLAEANVTAGNFCQTMLACHGLEDLANEALPANNRMAPEKKAMEFQDLLYCISYIVDIKGYTTKQEIKDNLAIEDTELDKLFRIFKQDIAEIFYYKRPTKKQMEQWGLTTLKFIYTRKEC